MDSKKVFADFQFASNRVSKFLLETKSLDTRGYTVNASYDVDYNILEIIEEEDRYIGLVEFSTVIKAKIKNSILYKINLCMEGIFLGNPKKLDAEQFSKMLELNGVATLSQLCRSYIISTSSLSGLNPPVKLPMINIHALREYKHSQKENGAQNNSLD
ncbi:MAG: hypothetical protein JG777_3228 [Clostridia bacterium]|jgi:preprotein translocase subunit SecB|nr:hypothetical protein [Clostridia bacterium]